MTAPKRNQQTDQISSTSIILQHLYFQLSPSILSLLSQTSWNICLLITIFSSIINVIYIWHCIHLRCTTWWFYVTHYFTPHPSTYFSVCHATNCSSFYYNILVIKVYENFLLTSLWHLNLVITPALLKNSLALYDILPLNVPSTLTIPSQPLSKGPPFLSLS